RSGLNAFSLSGRFSVKVATRSRTSVRMSAIAKLYRPAEPAGLVQTLIHASEPPSNSTRQDLGVGNVAQVVRDFPHVAFSRFPSEAIESREIHGTRIRPQRFFSRRVEIVLEIRHHQFSDGAVNRLARSQ